MYLALFTYNIYLVGCTLHDSVMSTGSFNGFTNDEIYGTTAVKDIPNNKVDQLRTVSHLTSTPRPSSTSNIFQSTAIHVHVSTQTGPSQCLNNRVTNRRTTSQIPKLTPRNQKSSTSQVRSLQKNQR